MPMQYGGGNKVSNTPMKMRTSGQGTAPKAKAMATPAMDNQSNSGVGAGGSTQVGAAGGRNQIGGKAAGIGTARIGSGGLAPYPGTSMKRYGAAKEPRFSGTGAPDKMELVQRRASTPFNPAKQKAMAAALRSRTYEKYGQESGGKGI